MDHQTISPSPIGSAKAEHRYFHFSVARVFPYFDGLVIDPDATFVPSGENDTLVTISRMPLQRLQTLPTRHIPQLHRLVPDPDAIF